MLVSEVQRRRMLASAGIPTIGPSTEDQILCRLGLKPRSGCSRQAAEQPTGVADVPGQGTVGASGEGQAGPAPLLGLRRTAIHLWRARAKGILLPWPPPRPPRDPCDPTDAELCSVVPLTDSEDELDERSPGPLDELDEQPPGGNSPAAGLGPMSAFLAHRRIVEAARRRLVAVLTLRREDVNLAALTAEGGADAVLLERYEATHGFEEEHGAALSECEAVVRREIFKERDQRQLEIALSYAKSRGSGSGPDAEARGGGGGGGRAAGKRRGRRAMEVVGVDAAEIDARLRAALAERLGSAVADRLMCTMDDQCAAEQDWATVEALAVPALEEIGRAAWAFIEAWRPGTLALNAQDDAVEAEGFDKLLEEALKRRKARWRRRRSVWLQLASRAAAEALAAAAAAEEPGAAALGGALGDGDREVSEGEDDGSGAESDCDSLHLMASNQLQPPEAEAEAEAGAAEQSPAASQPLSAGAAAAEPAGPLSPAASRSAQRLARLQREHDAHFEVESMQPLPPAEAALEMLLRRWEGGGWLALLTRRPPASEMVPALGLALHAALRGSDPARALGPRRCEALLRGLMRAVRHLTDASHLSYQERGMAGYVAVRQKAAAIIRRRLVVGEVISTLHRRRRASLLCTPPTAPPPPPAQPLLPGQPAPSLPFAPFRAPQPPLPVTLPPPDPPAVRERQCWERLALRTREIVGFRLMRAEAEMAERAHMSGPGMGLMHMQAHDRAVQHIEGLSASNDARTAKIVHLILGLAADALDGPPTEPSASATPSYGTCRTGTSAVRQDQIRLEATRAIREAGQPLGPDHPLVRLQAQIVAGFQDPDQGADGAPDHVDGDEDSYTMLIIKQWARFEACGAASIQASNPANAAYQRRIGAGPPPPDAVLDLAEDALTCQGRQGIWHVLHLMPIICPVPCLPGHVGAGLAVIRAVHPGLAWVPVGLPDEGGHMFHPGGLGPPSCSGLLLQPLGLLPGGRSLAPAATLAVDRRRPAALADHLYSALTGHSVAALACNSLAELAAAVEACAMARNRLLLTASTGPCAATAGGAASGRGSVVVCWAVPAAEAGVELEDLGGGGGGGKGGAGLAASRQGGARRKAPRRPAGSPGLGRGGGAGPDEEDPGEAVVTLGPALPIPGGRPALRAPSVPPLCGPVLVLALRAVRVGGREVEPHADALEPLLEEEAEEA
ncbi:hypothetical protein HYH03_011849 [Edaphochlamys debaryana]|uniref:Uncharacterized protein n=1 Tax=Edaphochlamys debaryana TaxID=47281 RepID=A0A835XU61_9CHLO|nr:hypothetical protein HYH03_011849 [Edaphochlamys debaryana]|eukprot:KAG2489742.1 hypothetical protein HYH03_011849 [Edaphochlamys debaryana]